MKVYFGKISDFYSSIYSAKITHKCSLMTSSLHSSSESSKRYTSIASSCSLLLGSISTREFLGSDLQVLESPMSISSLISKLAFKVTLVSFLDSTSSCSEVLLSLVLRGVFESLSSEFKPLLLSIAFSPSY